MFLAFSWLMMATARGAGASLSKDWSRLAALPKGARSLRFRPMSCQEGARLVN